MRETILRKTLLCLLLVLLAVLSCLFVAPRAESAEYNRAVVASIEDKSETVLKLTAASTLASAGISAIPGDTATPIAEKLADFTEYFLLILCVLYAEKYLLTIIGAAVFRILVPCACGALIVGMFWNPQNMRRLALRIALAGLAMLVAIPASIGASDMVYDAYRQNITETVQETEELNGDTSALSEADGNEGLIAMILDKLSETAAGLSDRAARLLNRYVEALAVLIVTSCILPLLALVFFVWLIKLLTGVNVWGALPHRRPFIHARPGAGSAPGGE